MIYTSYFAKQKKMPLKDTVYVSIAVGGPKYEVPYKLEHLDCIKPYGIFGSYDGEEYKRKYFERLERTGVERIRTEINRVGRNHENIILLCHEKDESICHRRMFAEWWKSKTGEEIKEYKEADKSGGVQLTLF